MELGPETDLELRRKLQAEVAALPAATLLSVNFWVVGQDMDAHLDRSVVPSWDDRIRGDGAAGSSPRQKQTAPA